MATRPPSMLKALILGLAITAAIWFLFTVAAHSQTATGVNYSSTAPAAPIGSINVHWQHDSSYPTVNASAYVKYSTVQVACPTSGDLSVPVSTALGVLPTGQGGIIDARGCQSATTWTNAISFTNPGTTLLLPCATITASQTLTIPAGIRNVAIRGCSYQGGSTASGTTGATVWVYTGSGNAYSIGDPTYAADTPGFLMENLNINTASGGSAAQALHFYRTQEIRLDNLYFNGDGGSGQTAIALDGTGNYTGGTFIGLHAAQFNTALKLTGHLSGSAAGDYANASTFIRIHINCPTSSGLPIAGTFGVDAQGADGNTWTGGDIEGCATMFHFGANATGNTITGLRSENSTLQFVADTGSSYNSVLMGGTLFTGQLTDAGTRNSFSDAFHHSTNSLNGDWYFSQADTTVTDHQRLGIGLGNERGRETEIQTDYGYRWLYGFTDGTSGEQWYEIQDLLNNVVRLNFGQGNYGGTVFNQQTALNSAGNGGIFLNSSTNAGTGGVVFGSGGATPTEVAAIDSTGNLTTFGNHYFYSGSTLAWQWNCASLTVCALHDSNSSPQANVFRAFPNSSTEIDSQGTASVTINNTSTGGTGGLTVYGGGSSYASTKLFAVQGNGSGGASYLFPSIASSSGSNCAKLDNSGYLSNAGAPCAVAPGSQNAATFYAGPPTGSPAAPTFRAIATTDIPTLNQPTSANAGTASASDHSPTQCAAGQYSTGNTTAWAANCAQVSYSQVSGTPTALPPNGSAGGDLSGNYPTPTVAKINGGAPPASTHFAGYDSGGKPVAAPNTLGCLDGYDHLPCTVYEMGLTSQTACTNPTFATAFTTANAGFYRITGNVYATHTDTNALTVALSTKQGQNASVTSHELNLSTATIGTSDGWNNATLQMQNLATSTAITWRTTCTGTRATGIWNIDLAVERVN